MKIFFLSYDANLIYVPTWSHKDAHISSVLFVKMCLWNVDGSDRNYTYIRTSKILYVEANRLQITWVNLRYPKPESSQCEQKAKKQKKPFMKDNAWRMRQIRVVYIDNLY